MNRSKAKRVGKSFEFLRFSVLASNPSQQSPFSSSWRCCGKGGALANAVAFHSPQLAASAWAHQLNP